MNRNELVDRCKAIIVEAYEEATEMIVGYLELHPKDARLTLCTEIEGGDATLGKALDSRVRRRQKARKAAAGTGSGPTAVPEWKTRDRRDAKRLLRSDPEVVSELSPDEQRALARALDRESLKRQQEREQISDEKAREVLGDDLVEGLDHAQELTDTEFLLIKARGNLSGFVKRLGEIGVENAPENWRERCLDWIEDNEGHLGMGKALLLGDNIDWTAFNDLLSKES